MSKKYCYLFTEGNAQMRELLGGKGANLAEMTNIGLPVPQGFTISKFLLGLPLKLWLLNLDTDDSCESFSDIISGQRRIIFF